MTTTDITPVVATRPARPAPAAFAVAARNVDGVPVAIDAVAGLAAQPVEPGWADSIYVNGRLRAGDRRFAYLVHVIVINGVRVQTVSLTDLDSGWARTQAVQVSADEFEWDRDLLYVRTPDLMWTGDLDRQEITAITPWGALHVTLRAEGPVLYYAGTGTYALLGNPQYQYALPRLRTRGLLTIGDERVPVTGDSWLDRQIGPLPAPHGRPWRFTWTYLNMPDGDTVALFDCEFVPGLEGADGTGESWATVLHPDGRHELAPVAPVARSARRPWTDPATGGTFPSEWDVVISGLQTDVTITVHRPRDPAVADGADGADDARPGTTSPIEGGGGPAAFRGTYLGRPVSGETYVDQIGAWRS